MLSSPMVSTQGETMSSMAIPSSHLDNTHDWNTSGMAWHNFPWVPYMVKRCWARYVINVLEEHKRSEDVGHVMTAWTLGSTHSRMMSGEVCHHLNWAAHAVGRR